MRGVPVVEAHGRAVYAQDLADVGELLGLPRGDRRMLAPQVLLERYLRILDVAVSAGDQIPEARLSDKLPGRDRSYLELLNHIVEIAASLVKVTEGMAFDGVIAEATPVPTRSREHNVECARDVHADLQSLCEASGARWQETVDTYYGEKSLHVVLERCTWHSAQHTRQLLMVLGTLDIVPEDPLTEHDLVGLPLPDEVWDA